LTFIGPFEGEVLSKTIVESPGTICIVFDESSVVVAESKERSDFFDGCWGWPIGDTLEFRWVHRDLVVFYDHAEEGYLFFVEFTFLRLEIQIVVSYDLQNFESGFTKFLLRFGINEDVVHVNNAVSLLLELLEEIIHHSLERCQ